ncbi:MAG UNVERIFIED_CONTAM: glycosyltransferase [Anaerolineae bacterium]
MLTAVFALQYPADRLIIQILDDSTDETTQLIQQMLKLAPSGVTVQHIRRPNRVGYKAGALTYGMAQSVTDYYAIFDSDFIPAPVSYWKSSPICWKITAWEWYRGGGTFQPIRQCPHSSTKFDD